MEIHSLLSLFIQSTGLFVLHNLVEKETCSVQSYPIFLLSLQCTKINKTSLNPANHGYGKNKICALQVSNFPITAFQTTSVLVEIEVNQYCLLLTSTSPHSCEAPCTVKFNKVSNKVLSGRCVIIKCVMKCR